MKIDIDKLTEAELVDLNNRIVVSEGEDRAAPRSFVSNPNERAAD
jgi:hypothetical protein